jgi:hypothetical protein
MKDRCLTDEEMTSYVDGVVAEDLRRKIEAHLASCPMCLHSVAELKELVSDETGLHTPVPESALARAESLIARYAGKETVRVPAGFDIVAVLRDGVCRILDTSGNLLAPRVPAPAAVRGDGAAALNPRVARSLCGMLVTVELKATGDKVKPLLTIIDEATSERPDGLKARIHAEGTSETRYTHAGKAEFSPVARGDYRIDIEGIGSIDLEVR